MQQPPSPIPLQGSQFISINHQNNPALPRTVVGGVPHQPNGNPTLFSPQPQPSVISPLSAGVTPLPVTVTVGGVTTTTVSPIPPLSIPATSAATTNFTSSVAAAMSPPPLPPACDATTVQSLKATFAQLTDRFFKSDEGKWSEQCKKKFGLEQPMWVWTHRALTEAGGSVELSPLSFTSPFSPTTAGGGVDRASSPSVDITTSLESTRIEHLLNWLITICHLHGSEICVVCTSKQKAILERLFNSTVGKELMDLSAPSSSSASSSLNKNNNTNTTINNNATANMSTTSAGHNNYNAIQKSMVTFLDHQELIMLKNRVQLAKQQQQQQQTAMAGEGGGATATTTTSVVNVVADENDTANSNNAATAAPSSSSSASGPMLLEKHLLKKFSIVIYAVGVPLLTNYLPMMERLVPQSLQAAAELLVGTSSSSSSSSSSTTTTATAAPSSATAAALMAATRSNQAARAGMPSLSSSSLKGAVMGRSGSSSSPLLPTDSSVAFITICDAAWLYAPVLKHRCPLWFTFINDVFHKLLPKIRMSKDYALKTLPNASLSSTNGLISLHLPICCPAHPQQRSMADGKRIFEGFCSAKCLKPFNCKENEAKLAAFMATSAAATAPNPSAAAKLLHRCMNRCHLSTASEVHNHCPYPCTNVIHPCGEGCKTGCCDRDAHCTCGHDVEVPLDCYHDIVVGFDNEAFTPITERVFHVFRGACNDIHKAKEQCPVKVPTICSVCSGDFVAPCHALTAVGHALFPETSRTAVCNDCVRRQRDIRSAVTKEIIKEIDVKRSKAQQDLKMQQYLDKLGKGAGAGEIAQQSFDIGQRVVIVNMKEKRAPYEMDHPECNFVYFHEEEAYDAKVTGGHGVVVKSVVDGSEQQYIILLSSGQHVLFASNGLKAVKAIGNFELTGASLTHTYLLTAGPERFQQQPPQPQDGGESSNAQNNNNTNGSSTTTATTNLTTTTTITTPFTALVKPQFGKTAIVLKPIAIKNPPRAFMITAANEHEKEDGDLDGKQEETSAKGYSDATPSYLMADLDDDRVRKEIQISNVVGTIIGEDAAASLALGQPMVKFQIDIKFITPEEEEEEEVEEEAAAKATEDGEPDTKRSRVEKEEGAATATNTASEPLLEQQRQPTPPQPAKQLKRRQEKTISMVVSAPFLHLEVIPLREARITEKKRQLVGPENQALFSSLAAETYAKYINYGKSSSSSSTAGNASPIVVIRDSYASRNEMFSVVGIVNHPIVRRDLKPFHIDLDVDEENSNLLPTKAPCVILQSRLKANNTNNSNNTTAASHDPDANLTPAMKQLRQLQKLGIHNPTLMKHLEARIAAEQQQQQLNANHGGKSSNKPQQKIPEGAVPLVVVPLVFVGVDEEAAAERQLEATEFAKLELLFEERYKKVCDDLFFVNEEKRSAEEQQMHAVKKVTVPIVRKQAGVKNLESGEAETDNAHDGVSAVNADDETATTIDIYAITPALLRNPSNNTMCTVVANEATATQHPATGKPSPILIFELGSSHHQMMTMMGSTPLRSAAADTTGAAGGNGSVPSSPFLPPAFNAVAGGDAASPSRLSLPLAGGGVCSSSLTNSAHHNHHHGSAASVVVGHVKEALLTPQQRYNGVWCYCYALPSPIVTAAVALELEAKRQKMPQTPSPVLLEIERKKQQLSSVQPSVKVIEEWGNTLCNALKEDAKADQQYGLSVSKMVEADCVKKGIPVSITIGR